MAKKIKYYGVLAIKTSDTKDYKGLPEELQKLIKGLTKKTTVARAFVFDNETEQVECLANVEGCDQLISIEAVSKEDFLRQVLDLKAEHIHNDDDEGSVYVVPGGTPSPS